MAGRSEVKIWKMLAVLLLAGMAAACGGNYTQVGVVVAAPGATLGSTATVITNGTLQFSAQVTGASATTVYWRICKPASLATIQPTVCTAIPGVTPVGAASLTGYGTITQTGLYTAPPTIPDPNTFVVMAISTISTHIFDTVGTYNTDFGFVNMQIDSGVRVQVFPPSATIGAGQTITMAATVTGSTNQSVNWLVNGIAGGNAQTGYICPNPLAPQPCTAGEYFAPATGVSAATITANAAADPSQSATSNITISTIANATVTALDPNFTGQGSAQQDVYLTGSNFFSNDTVMVAPPGQPAAAVPTTFINTALLRATIPANLLSQAGTDQISVVRQDGSANAPGPLPLTINPMRPAIVASSPDSIGQNPASAATLTLTGGFFSPATTVLFNGSSSGLTPSVQSSRQLSIAIPAGSLATPGLYPVVAQNSSIASPQPNLAAVNVAVTPAKINIPAAPIVNVGVGTSPSAVAVDYATGMAVVVNTGSNNVNLINLRASPPAVIGTVAVGGAPTGVAIDDMLPTHIAVVVNSADQTISTINLTTATVISTLSVAIGPTAGSAAGPAPVPYSVGVNPVTHRAVVAYESFNEATILDLSTGIPVLLQQIGGDLTAPIGTGTSPNVDVDQQLNWAVVTPGGGGAQTVTIIDLGHGATNGDVARSPQVVGSLALAAQGVGIDSETHEVLFTYPSASILTSFSLLDNSLNSITFMNAGVVLNELGFSGSAVNSLENVGIAVNALSSTAAIVDLENGNVLQTVSGLGTNPGAVAVDPVSNLAVVANQGSNNVSIVALGPALNPLQIVQSNPSLTFTSTSPLTLTVTGSFNSSSVVRVDEIPLTTTAVATTCVSTSCRQLTATVPASLLSSARNFAVDVVTGTTVSNVEPLTVVQSVVVGSAPTGVAVDNDRDLAVVTNSGSGNVSLVALSPTTPVGISQVAAGTVGTVGPPIGVGAKPLGVAVIPRLGLAVVANNGSNNSSLVDETQAASPQTVLPCTNVTPIGSPCVGPVAAAINQDTAQVVVTNSGSLTDTSSPSSLSFGTITAGTVSAAPTIGSTGSDENIDQNPVSVAIDPAPIPANPGISYAAVGTASGTSSVEVVDLSTQLPQRLAGFQNPIGMIFDPLSHVFIMADSLNNNLVIIDPISLVQTPVRVGINPTALDYDLQTSTLVTSNLASHTLSILDYLCAPSSGNAGCLTPQVKAVLGLGGSQQFSVAVDVRLNLAVVADQNNNRVLLVPLPH